MDPIIKKFLLLNTLVSKPWFHWRKNSYFLKMIWQRQSYQNNFNAAWQAMCVLVP